VDYYDSEYRRQYCQERIDRIRDDYRRAQRPPMHSQRSSRIIVRMKSIWERVRRQAPQRAPAYRL
jgi:hypothetical protein